MDKRLTAWTAARRDLEQFMNLHKDSLPVSLLTSARDLWKAGRCFHPSVSGGTAWYTKLVSDFITDCTNEINKPAGKQPAKKIAA